MSRLKKIVILLACLIILLPASAFGYLYFKMNLMYEEDDYTSDSSTEIEYEEDIQNDAVLDDNITNILIIGSDERNPKERGRSDAMMIATIDEKHKSLKLTSLARDTYVKIPGRGYEKLNHAYSYGGAKLLTKTIENNFGVGISHYVNINFTSFIDIIDALGGITLNVQKSEIQELNKYIPECYEASSNKKNKKMELISSPGKQVLNGYQALSYSRIRKNDSAFKRDGRQRAVLQSLLDEVSTMSFGEATRVANAVFPYIKTNIKPMEMLKYMGKVLKIGDTEIKQLEFPIAEYSKGGILKGKGWVLQFDAKKCLPILHKFIFGENVSDKYLSFIESYESETTENIEDTEIKEPTKPEKEDKPSTEDKDESVKPPMPDGGNNNSGDKGESSTPDTEKPSKPNDGTNNKPDNGDSSKPDNTPSDGDNNNNNNGNNNNNNNDGNNNNNGNNGKPDNGGGESITPPNGGESSESEGTPEV